MEYHLTLDQGTITESDTGRGRTFTGSGTSASWSPFNPLLAKPSGWQEGDKLFVTCSFNLSPTQDGNDIYPPANEYNGLVAGACLNSNAEEIAKLKQDAHNIPGGDPGQLIGSGITKATTKSANAIFYSAKPLTFTTALKPISKNRGTLTNFIYKWEATFNRDNTVADGEHVELVFGYGDPMHCEVNS